LTLKITQVFNYHGFKIHYALTFQQITILGTQIGGTVLTLYL